MKITFCTREHDNLSGGQNTWLCRFLPSLRRRGVELRVLCFTLSRDDELPTIRSLRQAGINCTTVSQQENEYTEQQIRWILERLAEDLPDVFVPNMVIPAAYYAGRWIREAGIPTVGTCHIGADHFLYPGLIEEFVTGREAYRVTALVCVSKYLEQDVLKQHASGVLVRSIPYGIQIPKDIAKRPNGLLRLAYVGRLSEEAKRISEVTHALCRAVHEVPGTEAFMYGDGEERAAVERIIREEADGLPVHLVGRVENDQIRKHLLESHVVVLLSDWEGLPVSVIEGMACGLVPIGFRHARGGVPELVEDGVTGLLVDNRGESFVTAVRRLREDPALWERLARSARDRAEAEYSDEVCAVRWEEFLRQLANSTAPRRPLRIPTWLHLPPVHPAFAADWLDARLPRYHQRVIQRVRGLADMVK